MSGAKDLYMKRISIVIVSLFFALIFGNPNTAFLLSFLLIAIHKTVALVFCIIAAWHFTKLVEPLWKKYLEEDKNEHEEMSDM